MTLILGIIGSGHIGGDIARLATGAGIEVVLSNSRGPESLEGLVRELGPRAASATPQDAARRGDIVVATIPLGRYRDLPADALTGKTVIDTMNYYPERDGHIAALDDGSTTTSEMTAAHLPQSKVVKAFNSIYAAEIGSTARPQGDAERRTLPIAGDDAQAKKVVTGLIEVFGFDVLDAGPLHEGFRFQNGTPAYCVRAGRAELEKLLAQA